MRITIFGSGYVGLVTAACFAERGNHVVCVDTDAAKVRRLKGGHIPFYEPGLSDLGDDVFATVEPSLGDARRPLPAPRAVVGIEEPLQLDPFGAAAVAADPLAVDEPFRGGPPQPPPEPTSEQPVAGGAFRVREVLVSAMALAAWSAPRGRASCWRRIGRRRPVALGP